MKVKQTKKAIKKHYQEMLLLEEKHLEWLLQKQNKSFWNKALNLFGDEIKFSKLNIQSLKLAIQHF